MSLLYKSLSTSFGFNTSDDLAVVSPVVDIEVLHCFDPLHKQLVVVVSDYPVPFHDQFQIAPKSPA